jgi:hypothetical protein
MTNRLEKLNSMLYHWGRPIEPDGAKRGMDMAKALETVSDTTSDASQGDGEFFIFSARNPLKRLDSEK